MDLLRQEMERKKAVLLKQKGSTKKRKYTKYSQTVAVEDDDLKKKTTIENTTSAKEEVSSAKSSSSEKKETNKNNINEVEDGTDENTVVATKEQMKSIRAKLRQCRMPVVLFGETFAQQQQRLEVAVQQQSLQSLQQTEQYDEFKLGQGHSIRNPFLQGNDGADDVVDTMTTQKQQQKEKKEKDTLLNMNTDLSADPHKRIYRHFKNLLKTWEQELNGRSTDVQRSNAGRKVTNTYKQCKDYIKPLFQLCKRRQLEEGLVGKLAQIVDDCNAGEFVAANDCYMDIAIGRAAWPIGVTMVGIHARSGRAKIESSNVAHVMNSELQRKYLTSIKRLITYHQTIATHVAPSKKVT